MARIENGRQPLDAVSIHTVGSQFDEESSFGSDSEINGFASDRHTDKYGFIGGAQKYSTENAQDVPPEVLRQREVKWLDMLNHWDRWLFKRHKKVRLRCQKGIPPSLRGRAWLYLSGGKVKKEQNKGKFKELDSMQGDPKWMDVIERDLHRQFPFHEMFVSRGGHGQQDLLRVLKAYTLYRPDEGYCQAQAPIAAVLLMHMPAEEAFWCLVQICERYLPGYYSAGLEAIQLDGEILYALLKRVCPVAYRHLDKHKIEPILYMTEWFMCAFSRTLPWASVLRVWDMFLCDGVKIIFRVGLVLLRSMLGTKDKLKASQGQYETMELLRAIEPRYMQEGYLVHQVLECPVSVRDVERENHVQLKRWRKKHGELSYKSAPRMHGALAVMAAEPHSRQDLYQNPTIVVQSPLDPSAGTPTLSRAAKKRATLRKSPKPIPDVPNPYALPSDPRLTPAPPPPHARTQPEGAADAPPAPPAPPADQAPPLLPPSAAPTRCPSPPHPPMFYQPPPQQPISSQPSPSLQPMSSQHSPPQQLQANGQPSVQQQQPIGSPPSPPQQPITTQPQRQHPPMFYQPPPQPIPESPATQPQPPPPAPSQTPPPPQDLQPITECLPQQEPISEPDAASVLQVTPDPDAPISDSPADPSDLPALDHQAPPTPSTDHTPCDNAPPPLNTDPTPCDNAPPPLSTYPTPCDHAPPPLSTDPTPCDHAPPPLSTDPTPCDHAPPPLSTDNTPCDHTPPPPSTGHTPSDQAPPSSFHASTESVESEDTYL
ncbi:TBC1 domain family member 10A-like [Alosa pseudoharengus]|uniref:TBC1 domain family member 10A-like n=1 Tax=Alosa pseudoharengus TaxID=34774 RepID=UPI003F89C264